MSRETMHKKRFVPDDFEIPLIFETDEFRLRMLSINDVKKDYEAVIESQELLHKMFGSHWPKPEFSLEENLKDLEIHQKEFLSRKAFAYTVITLDETRVLGCVYIDPPENADSDAVVVMWVRQTEYNKGLDKILFNKVRDWINLDWPFKKVDYPGR